MKVLEQEIYDGWKNTNNDAYGSCIFRYAEAWANAMEQEIENGRELQDVAGKLSFKVDEEGITGFMYAAAVNILSQCWVHGEELRKWHISKAGITK